MKFIDIINEDVEPQPINEDFQIDKKLNKAKLIYKTFKRGKIFGDGGGNYSIVYYELVDPIYKIIDEHNNGDIIDKNVYIISRLVTYTDDKLLVQTCNPNNLDEPSLPSLRINILKSIAQNIVDKFYNVWDIVLSINLSDIEVNYRPKEPQSINEGEDKRIKRARTIYKAFKKGLLNKGEHGSVRYELPDEYKVYVRSIDDVLVIRVGEEEDDNHVKFFFNYDDDGTGDRPTKAGPKYYNAYVGKIWEKYFNNFDIKLIC